MIATLPPYVPPSVLKRQLSEVTAKLKAARTAINELPPVWRNLLHASHLPSELLRVSKKRKELASSISAKKRSGGDPGKRRAAIQKRIAAEQAFDLLDDYGGQPPTLTKNGKYYRLAGMLIEVATERESAGDMEDACTRVITNMRKDGFPTAAERRRGEGKLAVKTMTKLVSELTSKK